MRQQSPLEVRTSGVSGDDLSLDRKAKKSKKKKTKVELEDPEPAEEVQEESSGTVLQTTRDSLTNLTAALVRN